MTKRALFFLGAILLVRPCALRAQDDLIPGRTPNSWVGFSIGRFSPSDVVFQDVYGPGGSRLGLLFGRDLYVSGRLALSLGLEIDRFSREGVSTISATKSRIQLVPVRLGPEIRLASGSLAAWLGGGLDLVFYTEDSPWALMRGSAFGYHLAGGFAVQLPKALALRVFARWSQAAEETVAFTAELGGAEIGVDLIFRFKL